jgi:hypothetical protein
MKRYLLVAGVLSLGLLTLSVPGQRQEPGDRAGPLVAARPRTHRDGALRSLAVADHEHVGDLLELGLPDLISNLFLPLVDLDPEPLGRQASAHLDRSIEVPLGDGQHHGLDRREPERDRAAVELD